MSNYRMNSILEGLSDISEAKQKLWYIEYTSKGTTDAKVICNSQSYNKYKKFAQGYKEIQKTEITNSSEKSFYTAKIRNELEDRYGIKDYTGNSRFDTYTKDGYACTVVGKYNTDSYGYMVSDNKLEESTVNEAKQKLLYIEFRAESIKDAKYLCSVKAYNQIKKNYADYKEIEKVEILDDNDKTSYTNKIKDELVNKYGIKKYQGDNTGWDVETKDGYGGMIIGKYKTSTYGYEIYDVKISKSSVDEGIKMIEADADAQYKVYKETGKYPEKKIVKAEWELDKADDSHIFLIKDGKKRKFKVIPDDRGMRGFIGKPMKTGVKAVGGVDGFIEAMTREIKSGPGGESTVARNIFNGIWDTCKDAK